MEKLFEDFQWVEPHEDWGTLVFKSSLKSISPETSEAEDLFKISNTKTKQGDHEGTISNEEVTNMPEEKPTAIVMFEIDGIPNEQVVFTSADAAFNSEQFSSVLSWMEEYNAENRGKRLKAGLRADFQNSFDFLTKSAAMDFANRATKDYNDTISEKYKLYQYTSGISVVYRTVISTILLRLVATYRCRCGFEYMDLG